MACTENAVELIYSITKQPEGKWTRYPWIEQRDQCRPIHASSDCTPLPTHCNYKIRYLTVSMCSTFAPLLSRKDTSSEKPRSLASERTLEPCVKTYRGQLFSWYAADYSNAHLQRDITDGVGMCSTIYAFLRFVDIVRLHCIFKPLLQNIGSDSFRRHCITAQVHACAKAAMPT